MKRFVNIIWSFAIICVSVHTIPAKSQNVQLLGYIIPIFSTTFAQSPYISRGGNYEGYYMPQNPQLNPHSQYYDHYSDSIEQKMERIKPFRVTKTEHAVTRYDKENNNENKKYKNKGSATEMEHLTTYEEDAVKSQSPLELKSPYNQNNPNIEDYYSEINPHMFQLQNALNMNLQQRMAQMQLILSAPGQLVIKPIALQPVSVDKRMKISTQKSSTRVQEKPKVNPSAISDFGFNIMKLASTSAENFAISPYSIALILALVQQGTHGKAEEQITNALGMTPSVSAAAFRNFVNLKRQPSRNILKIATNLFVSNLFQLEPEFKRNALQNFDSQASILNFRNVVDASNSINDWIASKTQQRIKDLIKPGVLTQATKLVMANAIYFKGIWKTLFHPNATISRSFTKAGGDTVMVPFMRLRKSFLHGYDNEHKLQFISLPFEGEQQSLMLLLPDVGQTIDKVLLRLKGSRLAQYQNSNLAEVEVEIPKFAIKEDLDLDPVFRSLGITDIFTPYLSNLDGIGNLYGVPPEISKAVHSAMLSIDEEGATAAASTAFAAVALSYDEFETFKADRPFIAVLWDNQLQVPLFLVRVEDPTL